MHILLIEDYVGIRTALKVLLDSEGHHTTVVSGGLAGLERFEQETFDLILLDLKVRDLTAIEFLSQLKNICLEKKLKLPKFGILSASSSIQAKAQALCVDFFIQKPFGPEELLAKINGLRPEELCGTASKMVV